MVRSSRAGLVNSLGWLSVVAWLSALSCGESIAATSPEATAEQILAEAGICGGLIVQVPAGDGRLAAALGAKGEFIVQGLVSDDSALQQARQTIKKQNAYGPVSVRAFDGKHLPYLDRLVNLVVVTNDGVNIPQSELERVLCPGGAVVRVRNSGPEVVLRKPWPETIDQWTHWLHAADGNAVADDKEVGPPRSAQWLAPPRWQRHHETSPSINAMVSAGGRLFAIINEAPAGIDGLPDRWTLVARDAFNGKLLWKRPIEQWGWQYWGDHSYGNGRWNHPTQVHRRMVAVGDRVYVTLGFNAALSELDAATGQVLQTYVGTEYTDEVLYDQGTLILSVNTEPQGPGKIREKPPVKKQVVAVDAESGKVLWRSSGFVGIASKADAIERETHLSPVVGGGRVFCIEDDAVIALDRQTGQRLWKVDRPERPKRPVTYGSYYFTNLCSMVYHDGLLLFMEPDPTVSKQPWNAPVKAMLRAIAAEDGRVLWSRSCGLWGHYNQGDIFCIGELIWVHDWSNFALLGLEPETGEVKRTLNTQVALDQGHHHRCYRNKATTEFVITGRRGVETIDLDTGQNLRNHWVRGACRYGVLPCNGLLYAPPHPCICYITAKLTGFWALKASPTDADTQSQGRTPVLQRGPAFASIQNAAAAVRPAQDAWPTYRHDAARTGCADRPMIGMLRTAWTADVGTRLTAPVIAQGRVMLADRATHTIYALAEDDGRRLWSFVANGPVDTPPTVFGSFAIFGSADGSVYCLRAADGELVWRLNVASRDVQMIAYDQLQSPWPIHGTVLIHEGTVYFAAGRSSFLDGGIRLYAVQPLTGEVLAKTTICSLDPETGDMAECRLPYDMPLDKMGALPDVLVSDGSTIHMRQVQINPIDLSYTTAAVAGSKKRTAYPMLGGHVMSVAGILDNTWFNQTYWTVDGAAHCKLLVCNDQMAFGVKPSPGSARHSRAIFRPGEKGYTLRATIRPRHQPAWSVQILLRIQAMVLAGPTLFAAGTPDVIDVDDPWGAIEGRLGGELWAISAETGEKRSGYELKSPPVYDGMAAAGGRLFVSTSDGALVCFENATGADSAAKR